MSNDLVKRMRDTGEGDIYLAPTSTKKMIDEAADRIELLEKGLCDILILDDPMLMRMIAKACLTGAIDNEGKYCFVPSVALEGKDAPA